MKTNRDIKDFYLLPLLSMDWVKDFDLFLFDFDGLLVDTERLHYRAYQLLCERHGERLPWDFDKYCSVTHGSASGIREDFYRLFPKMVEKQPNWDLLYKEKKQIYLDLLGDGNLVLMEGAALLLEKLLSLGVKRCVVTHSAKEQVEAIKKMLPILKSIPFWITREDYENPKPAPDGYLKALELLEEKGDRVVGFEDSLRGFKSLKAAIEYPILICSSSHSQLKDPFLKDADHFTSFLEIDSISLKSFRL